MKTIVTSTIILIFPFSFFGFFFFFWPHISAPTGIVNVIDGEAGSITRADVAKFCLDAIYMDDFPYIGKTPCISSVGGTSWQKDRSARAREGMVE
jgi:hypothetical protein